MKKALAEFFFVFIVIFSLLQLVNLNNYQKGNYNYVQFINSSWNLQLPEENFTQLYYQEQFLFKGEGYRYLILQYDNDTINNILLKNTPFSEITTNDLKLDTDLLSFFRNFSISSEYLLNSCTDQYFFYSKKLTDKFISVFYCEAAYINEEKKSNIVFILEDIS